VLRIARFTLAALITIWSYSTLAQDSPDSVQFKVKAVPSKNAGESSWLATYGDDAKFVISLRLVANTSRNPFVFSKGSFAHVNGSKPEPFLAKLASALGAKSTPTPTHHLQELLFDVAIFGEHETRLDSGGFASRTEGNWIVTKIFVAKGQGEVYLNIDPVVGVGEFSLKDQDYGDTVLSELASVL